MTAITYEVVPHDGGWAYKANGTFSEPFQTRQEAEAAAQRAAAEQEVPGDTRDIEFEDKAGTWKTEASDGHDRPDTEVKTE